MSNIFLCEVLKFSCRFKIANCGIKCITRPLTDCDMREKQEEAIERENHGERKRLFFFLSFSLMHVPC